MLQFKQTAGSFYQNINQKYKIYNLRKESVMIKERIQKTSIMMLYINDLEHDKVGRKLTAVINNQQELNMKILINPYVDLISVLMRYRFPPLTEMFLIVSAS